MRLADNERTVSGPKRRKRVRLLPALTIANLLFLLALWLAEMLVAERHWLTTILVYAPQHPVGVPTVLLLAWSLWRRQRAVLVLNLAALMFFVFALLGFNVPLGRGRARAQHAVPLRVMTWNIHHAYKGAVQIMDQVNETGAEVLCFQEAYAHGPWRDPVPELRWLLYGWHMAQYGELVTFSRYPIVAQRDMQSDRPGRLSVLETVLRVKGRRVTVFNLHLSTAANPRAVLSPLASASTSARLRHTGAERSQQVTALLHIIAQAPPPIVVAGDFNTPPRGRLYARLANRMRDTFRAAGWGLGCTFRSDLPVLRIDYVFFGPGIGATACRVPKTRASDHRPVFAELTVAIPPPKASR